MERPRITLEHVERAHVAYWLFGAIWPLVSMRSFERVTGNKRDEWLVRTVALMMLSVVATLETARRSRSENASLDSPPNEMMAIAMSNEASRNSRSEEAAVRVLGATSAAALGGVALIGALVGRISPVYLMDAAVDTTLAVLWTLAPHRRLGARSDGSDDPMG